MSTLEGYVEGMINLGGGGGGGSNVTIEPTLETGTKIADYTIDETSGELYAPTPVTYTAGENVQISEQNVISATDTTYTAGNNIQISEQNVISAKSSQPIYSTTEQVIGKWIDDRDVYEKTLIFQSANANTETRFDCNISNMDFIVEMKSSCTWTYSQDQSKYIFNLPYASIDGSQSIQCFYYINQSKFGILPKVPVTNIVVILRYVKAVNN